MSNYRMIIFIGCCALWLVNCKPASKSFSYEHNIDKEFFEETFSFAGLGNMKPNLVKIYRAELTERLVERDAVPEYRLINKESEQPYARLSDIKNKNYLYLFQVLPPQGSDTVFIYMGTTISAAGHVTALGPVYLGIERRDRIQFKNVLKIAVQKNQSTKLADTTEQGYKIKRFNLAKKDTTHLIFFNDQRFPAPADLNTPIRITQIIRNVPNKIGGKKALIFTTEKVFEDPNALVFIYFNTINFK